MKKETLRELGKYHLDISKISTGEFILIDKGGKSE